MTPGEGDVEEAHSALPDGGNERRRIALLRLGRHERGTDLDTGLLKRADESCPMYRGVTGSSRNFKFRLPIPLYHGQDAEVPPQPVIDEASHDNLSIIMERAVQDAGGIVEVTQLLVGIGGDSQPAVHCRCPFFDRCESFILSAFDNRLPGTERNCRPAPCADRTMTVYQGDTSKNDA